MTKKDFITNCLEASKKNSVATYQLMDLIFNQYGGGNNPPFDGISLQELIYTVLFNNVFNLAPKKKVSLKLMGWVCDDDGLLLTFIKQMTNQPDSKYVFNVTNGWCYLTIKQENRPHGQ